MDYLSKTVNIIENVIFNLNIIQFLEEFHFENIFLFKFSDSFEIDKVENDIRNFLNYLIDMKVQLY